jgi:hypothetical protein
MLKNTSSYIYCSSSSVEEQQLICWNQQSICKKNSCLITAVHLLKDRAYALEYPSAHLLGLLAVQCTDNHPALTYLKLLLCVNHTFKKTVVLLSGLIRLSLLLSILLDYTLLWYLLYMYKIVCIRGKTGSCRLSCAR